MKILVTGTAGFIGYHLAKKLLERGDTVIGLDNLNEYYDVNLKYARLAASGILKEEIEYNKSIHSKSFSGYSFIQLKLEDKSNLEKLFEKENFNVVINLAAQAGVRYSLTNPHVYVDSNIVGFMNVLECARHYNIKHLVYASSSSVYGLNESIPFKTSQNVDHPISLYAASKKSNELMAHVYSHLFNIPSTGLRFFTVYGPWGRPDMALFLFTKAILVGKPIQIFNNGNMTRDFTYVDDIIEGVIRVTDNPPAGNEKWDAKSPEPSESKAPYKIYNLGNNSPVRLMDMVEILEKELGKKAVKDFQPMQPGDVLSTYADISDLISDMDYKPGTDIEKGIKKFVEWYKDYYSE